MVQGDTASAQLDQGSSKSRIAGLKDGLGLCASDLSLTIEKE